MLKAREWRTGTGKEAISANRPMPYNNWQPEHTPSVVPYRDTIAPIVTGNQSMAHLAENPMHWRRLYNPELSFVPALRKNHYERVWDLYERPSMHWEHSTRNSIENRSSGLCFPEPLGVIPLETIEREYLHHCAERRLAAAAPVSGCHDPSAHYIQLPRERFAKQMFGIGHHTARRVPVRRDVAPLDLILAAHSHPIDQEDSVNLTEMAGYTVNNENTCRPSALRIDKTLSEELSSPIISPLNSPTQAPILELSPPGTSATCLDLGQTAFVSREVSTDPHATSGSEVTRSMDMRRNSLHEEFAHWKAKLEDGGNRTSVTEDVATIDVQN